MIFGIFFSFKAHLCVYLPSFLISHLKIDSCPQSCWYLNLGFMLHWYRISINFSCLFFFFSYETRMPFPAESVCFNVTLTWIVRRSWQVTAPFLPEEWHLLLFKERAQKRYIQPRVSSQNSGCFTYSWDRVIPLSVLSVLLILFSVSIQTCEKFDSKQKLMLR